MAPFVEVVELPFPALREPHPVVMITTQASDNTENAIAKCFVDGVRNALDRGPARINITPPRNGFRGTSALRVLSLQCKKLMVDSIDNVRALDRRDTEVHFGWKTQFREMFGW